MAAATARKTAPAQAASPEPTTGLMTPAAEARRKIALARNTIAAGLIEREEEVDLLLTALVAGEHLLLVGAPGTAKSMLCDSAAALIRGKSFHLLVNKLTMPDELFGPVSFEGLKRDEFRRVTTNRLPEADVAFIDEVFKAGPAILNTTLKVLNERKFDNGGTVTDCPLKVCVGASNEWPANDAQELGALFDRFLIRKTVRAIASAAGRERLMFEADLGAKVTEALSLDELDAAKNDAAAMPWTAEAKATLFEIIRNLAAEGIVPGDRRQRKAVGVARAFAYVCGATEVRPDHLEVLSHVLWDDPREHPAKAAGVIARLSDPQKARLGELLGQVDEITSGFDPKDLTSVSLALRKLTEVEKEMRKLTSDRAQRAADGLATELKTIKQRFVG